MIMKSIILLNPSSRSSSSRSSQQQKQQHVVIIPITFVILTFICISTAHSSPSCGLYGAPPCQYLPAPPGQTPACARPGKTYCEHIENYPTYLIKHLVHKWGYEAKNLIVDETWEEFHALTWHETPVFYDPAFIFPQHHHSTFNGNQNDFNGYDYDLPPPHNGGGGGGGGGGLVNQQQHNDGKFAGEKTFLITKQHSTTPTPTFLLYSSAAQHLQKNGGHNGHHKLSTPNSPTFWLKRIVRDLSQNAKTNHSTMAISEGEGKHVVSTSPTRDVSLNMDLLEIMGIEQPKHQKKPTRFKRQSPGRTSLCQTNSQFVAPQAALNNKGSWMFVVNEPSAARQLVKAELCASNTCSNLCQLPTGYNSRCEQKFAQKRLIALQANGQNLYTDTFWFPSCCVCTISSG